MAELVMVMITAPAGQAEAIARTLVERGLAACVSVLPGAHSTYRWQGAIEEADESVLLVKTRNAAVPRLTELVQELHSAENPEVIALPIEGGSAPYLSWLAQSVELPEDDAPYFH